MVKFQNVVVLMGGISSERDVSLRSGAAIAQGLRDGGCNVREVVLNSESLMGVDLDCDAVYIALHGGWGENGGVQAELEKRKIPYTGAGPEASRIAMDKALSKEIFDRSGIPNAPWQLLRGDDTDCDLQFPVVVKPPRDGSSVGLTCPCDDVQFLGALDLARKIDDDVLVEEYIPGKEYTCAVIAGEAMPVIEIAPKSGVYDFKSKYTSGATVYTALDDNDFTRKMQEIAKRACEAIGIRGLARVDFRVTENGEMFVLEINTLPGFTATSLVPKSAAKAGLSFSEICIRVLNLATY